MSQQPQPSDSDQQLDDMLCRLTTGYTRKELLTYSEEETGLDKMEVKEELESINRALPKILAWHQKGVAAARVDELDNFEPFFKGDHSKCIDPRTCIGYQNAQSDFDNERELRIAELAAQSERTK